MFGIRRLVTILLGSGALLAPAGLVAQSTATLTVTTKTAGGVTTIPYGSCDVEVEEEVPDGVQTDIVDIRFVEDDGDASAAPIDLTVWIGEAQSFQIAKDDRRETLYLSLSELAGSEISVRSKAGESAFCILNVPKEEEDQLEIDDAFQILAGVEFINVDGFQEQTAHIPAAARWIIPVRVKPADPQPDTHYWARKQQHWYHNPYALLITSAEYTRIIGEERNFVCSGTNIASSVDPGSVTGTECSPNQPKGTDSLTVFREQTGPIEYGTLGAWRITSTYRREGNLGWADNDVYAGPMLTVGMQTDPGIGAPDFFPFYRFGLSLTQVQIEDDYFTERFNLQLSWGESANYAERVVLLPDSTEERDVVHVANSNRLYVNTTFQPLEGYLFHGSAEFGRGVPDVARLSIQIRLDVEKLIGSIFGEKEATKTGSD